MPVRARSSVPSIKDRSVFLSFVLAPFPAGAVSALFINPWYDYEIKSIAALVRVATGAVAGTGSPFTLGYGDYTDSYGTIHPANPTAFLTAANCLDHNGALFGSVALPLGVLNVIPVQHDPTGLGLNILRAGSPLIVGAPTVTNTGQVLLNVVVRPKDLDRGDASKRPWGASDAAYANYYK
jgi:hypothetical protein